MEILHEEGLPREGICITCPYCGSETNLELKPTFPVYDEEIVTFSGTCSSCGLVIDYESRNPSRTIPDQLIIIEE